MAQVGGIGPTRAEPTDSTENGPTGTSNIPASEAEDCQPLVRIYEPMTISSVVQEIGGDEERRGTRLH